MRILILGGTVFLSRTVAEFAVAEGLDVWCGCRGTSGPLPAGVRHVRLDRDDAERLEPARHHGHPRGPQQPEPLRPGPATDELDHVLEPGGLDQGPDLGLVRPVPDQQDPAVALDGCLASHIGEP